MSHEQSAMPSREQLEHNILDGVWRSLEHEGAADHIITSQDVDKRRQFLFQYFNEHRMYVVGCDLSDNPLPAAFYLRPEEIAVSDDDNDDQIKNKLKRLIIARMSQFCHESLLGQCPVDTSPDDWSLEYDLDIDGACRAFTCQTGKLPQIIVDQSDGWTAGSELDYKKAAAINSLVRSRSPDLKIVIGTSEDYYDTWPDRTIWTGFPVEFERTCKILSLDPDEHLLAIIQAD
jgi:hypothetical protein